MSRCTRQREGETGLVSSNPMARLYADKERSCGLDLFLCRFLLEPCAKQTRNIWPLLELHLLRS